jgi:hypothetical protein
MPAGWQPKLQVVLTTKPRNATNVDAPALTDDTGDFDLNVAPVVHVTRQPATNTVILLCDDVSVNAGAAENGALTYSFSCKGKAALVFDGNRVTGDSISSSEGVLTINNAVIQIGEQASLKADTLQLTLSILGFQVQAANAEQHRTKKAGSVSVPDDRFNAPFRQSDDYRAPKPEPIINN